jgi:hypothetical protein
MARTLEELDGEMAALRSEFEDLKHRCPPQAPSLRSLAGCFTGDLEWSAIHEGIEAKRRIPDPELAGS